MIDDDLPHIPTLMRHGESYAHVDASSLNLDEMDEVARAGRAFAYQLHEGEHVTLVEHHATLGDIKHDITAREGDWFEVDLPEDAAGKSLEQLIAEGDQHIFSDAVFKLMFHEVQETSDDEDENKPKRGSIYEYIGELGKSRPRATQHRDRNA